MNIQCFDDKDAFPYLIIDELYNQEELNLLMNDFDKIKFKDSEDDRTFSAKNEKGKVLKRARATMVYPHNFTDANILKKVFMEKWFLNHSHWFYQNLKFQNINVLLSYYENQDYYKRHYDTALITCLTWFHKVPKKFSGGDFKFSDYNISIECKSNRMIVFPSMIFHEVDEIKMKEEDCNQGYGRYCFSHFLTCD